MNQTKKQTSYFSVTDLFCGAGGSTTGAKQAGAEVMIACNHWDRAIETHNSNYPGVTHVKTDISTADPRNFPSTLGLIASPECVNHTLAKGKKRKNLNKVGLWDAPVIDPAEERSRCTMWDPIRFAEYHNYQFVIIENVVDARMWSLWDAWLAAWKALLYRVEIVYLNSMFAHPTPQSRDRMYIVCTKEGNPKPNLTITPAAWCVQCAKDVASVQSWKDPFRHYGKYGKSGQYVYRCPGCAEEVTPYYFAAANAIDWSIPTQRIGDRKKSLQPKTMDRIRLGLSKFRKQDSSFLLNLFHATNTQGYVYDPQSHPYPAQTTRQELALVHPPFLFSMNHQTAQYTPMLDQPARTQTSYDATGVVMPPFIVELRAHSTVRGVEEPLATLCAGGTHHGLLTPPFLIDHIAEYRVRDITAPISTIAAEGNHQSVILPSWLMTYYNNGQMPPVEQAMPTVTTLERHALVTGNDQDVAVEECGFRMLEPQEIKAAMAFPADYIITGNRREQVKQLGNAVTAPAMRILVKRVLESLETGM